MTTDTHPQMRAFTSSRNPIAGAIAELPAALKDRKLPATASSTTDQSDSSPARWGSLVDQLGGREEAANDPASVGDGDAGDALSIVHERALVRNVVARRFVLARELNGLSQTEGAHAIGYAKSGQLSLIESGRKAPPLDVLVKASEAYSVSIDFLLGVSDHEERDPRLARRAAMRSFVDGSIRGLADVLVDVGERLIEAPAVDAEPLAATAGRVIEAFARYARQEGFEEVRGGATLAAAVGALDEALGPVMKGLHRHAALDAQLRQRIAEARRGSASTENGASVRVTVTRT